MQHWGWERAHQMLHGNAKVKGALAPRRSVREFSAALARMRYQWIAADSCVSAAIEG